MNKRYKTTGWATVPLEDWRQVSVWACRTAARIFGKGLKREGIKYRLVKVNVTEVPKSK